MAKTQPTIVVSARSQDGDRANVTVTMDGTVIAKRLDGNAIEVDPGEHVFRFELAGYEPVEQRLIIHEGERGRLVSVHFGAPPTEKPAAAPPPPSTPVPPPTEPIEEHRPVPIAAYVLGGTALIATGVFSGFALSGLSSKNSLRSECAPYCRDEDLDPARTKFLVADIALGVAVAAAVAGIIVFVERPVERRKVGAALSARSSPRPQFPLGIEF